MAWTRIDDKFLMNPKVQSAGAYGMALYLSGLIYCNTNLTDGFISDVMLPVLCGLAYQTPNRRIAEKLVALNLWERVPGGYQIHDFLMFNKSKHDIELLNKQRAVNGAKNKQKVQQTNTRTGAETGAEIGTGTGAETGSNSVPIIPNTLIPNTLIPNKELKDSTTTVRARAENSEIGKIAKTYESEIGMLTGAVREALIAALEDYPTEWISEAMREAARMNKRSWKYAEGILKRWKVDGFKVDTRKQAASTARQKPDMGNYKVSTKSEVVIE